MVTQNRLNLIDIILWQRNKTKRRVYFDELQLKITTSTF